MRANVGIAALALCATASAQAQDSTRVAFVTCPIVQDTPTVPCWLVEYEGETLYMGIQTDVSAPFNPPSLGHKVLVEGELTDREICGARVIEPIKMSIMPELSPECDEMRPAREGIDLGFEPPRPPGPSRGRLAFDYIPETPSWDPPFEVKQFTVPYPYEGMIGFRSVFTMQPAFEYAQGIDASRVEVTGYRGATRLSDGTLLVEHEGIASERAEEVARMLRGAGLEQAEFVVSAVDEAIEGGPDTRRVEITIVP